MNRRVVWASNTLLIVLGVGWSALGVGQDKSGTAPDKQGPDKQGAIDPAMPVAPAGKSKPVKVNPRIKRFDKDGDGKLNADEKAAAQAEFKKDKGKEKDDKKDDAKKDKGAKKDK